jgi:phenylacetate-coenzyme A ligase PaaK-like adenylate-forming protein
LADDIQVDSLRYVLLTAEPAFPHIIETIERAFGVPAIREYGSIECGILAAEWPDRTLRVREDQAILETTPRSDGHYDIIVTVLGNGSFPLLRYAIGDVTDRPLEYGDTGFAQLHDIVGRDNDLVVSRSGRTLHPLWFDDLFENTAGARRWSVHQDATGAVSVTVEVAHDTVTVDCDRVANAIEAHLDGYSVSVSVVRSMTQNQAGKHRWVVSELMNSDRAVRTSA